MRSLGRLVLCVLLLAGPTGCISWFTDPMGYRNAYDQTQRQYTQHLRWGEVEKAGSFVDPALREAFLQQAPVFQTLRITDFSIGEVAYQDDSAKVTVTYQGYSLTAFVEREIREEQNWYRDEESGRWLVRSDVGAFSKVFGQAR